mgnify:CR=1 FL=1
MNKVILKGTLGCDPKRYIIQDGGEIAAFILATHTLWKEPSEEWEKYTDWHQVIVFRKTTLKWMQDILKEGDPVYVEGKLSYHQWEDDYGQTRYNPYIIVLDQEGCVKQLHPKHPFPQEHFLEEDIPLSSQSCWTEDPANTQ